MNYPPYSILNELGLTGTNYMQIVVALFLFVCVLYKPERIGSPLLFRLSAIFIALSMLFPPIISAILPTAGLSPFPGRPGSMQSTDWMISLLMQSGSMFVGLAFLFGVTSIAIKTPVAVRSAPAAPARHPLDD